MGDFTVHFALSVLVWMITGCNASGVHLEQRSCSAEVFGSVEANRARFWPLNDSRMKPGLPIKMTFQLDQHEVVDGGPNTSSYIIQAGTFSFPTAPSLDLQFRHDVLMYFGVAVNIPLADVFFLSTSPLMPRGAPLDLNITVPTIDNASVSLPVSISFELHYDHGAVPSQMISEDAGTYTVSRGSGIADILFEIWVGDEDDPSTILDVDRLVIACRPVKQIPYTILSGSIGGESTRPMLAGSAFLVALAGLFLAVRGWCTPTSVVQERPLLG